MRIEARENPRLPQLAWCARVKKDDSVVELEHGPSVEIRENFFFEGAWSGSGAARDYLQCPIICGTGGAIQEGRAHFTTSSDRICPLFSIQKDRILHISNSPLFAMVSADEEPHELYPFYFYDFVRYWRMGLLCPSGSIKLASRHKLRVHFNTIVKVGRDGALHFERHRAIERPADYASCHASLLQGIKGLFGNASDPGRKRPLSPLAAISKGYDSTASATLAALAGCKEAYTFLNEEYESPDEDSGKENAEILGMKCQEYGRWAYRTQPGVVDAEFAMLGVAAPVPMVSLEEKLRGRLLVTGHYGDVFWDLDSGLCDNLTMPWSRFLSGVNILEFRLRAGFNVFTPTPVAARHNRDIQRIIFSDEMKPWWIRAKYNRPFARRIAEEAGLERSSFGMKKHAGGHAHHHTGEGFTEEGRRSYFRFLEARDSRAGKLRAFYWKKRLAICHWLWKFLTIPRQHTAYSGWRRVFPFLGNVPPKKIEWKYQFTFAWSFQVLRKRYDSDRGFRKTG